MSRVLFVCLGNICRSPMAEGIFRKIAFERDLAVEIASAGTSGYHMGEPADRRARQTAQRRGVDLDSIRSQQIAPRDFLRFDRIIAMDRSNMIVLKQLAPSGTKSKLSMMLDTHPSLSLSDVPDPYYNDGFESVFDMLEAACEGLADEIAALDG